MTGHRVVFGLGSNVVNGREILEEAINQLRNIAYDVVCSEIYQTKPFSGTGNYYMNSAVSATYDGEYDCLNEFCKKMEICHGRTEACRASGIVPLDIDIVLWDNVVVRPKDFSRNYFQQGYLAIENQAR